jgi:LysM repeat protein
MADGASAASAHDPPPGTAGSSLFHEHKVGTLDSLASLAIKYGVTPRDIKRANGGTITDATLHARAVIRVPKHTLAEGAPLPGGGGVTGASRPSATQKAAVTPALEKMRVYYGTSPAEERARVASEPAAGALSSDPGASPPSRPGGSGHANTASTLRRVGSGESVGGLAGGDANANANATATTTTSAAVAAKAEGRYGSALSGGAMPASAFQGRSKALMSPPARPGAVVGATEHRRDGGAPLRLADAGAMLFDRVKKRLERPPAAKPAAEPRKGKGD